MTTTRPAGEIPKPRRRWFRYSLRTLFVAMTIAAVWLGLTMKRLRDQERAVARILESGGKVWYDYQYDANGDSIPNAEPPGPKWIRSIFGPQWNVGGVRVSVLWNGSFPTDEDLKLLNSISGLSSLAVGGDAITDAGLVHVGQLRNLEILVIENAQLITDDGLTKLSNLRKLEILYLQACNLDGSGLLHVKQLPINFLNLNSSPVRDAHLASLPSMTQLHTLSLERTAITSLGLVHIKAMKDLLDLRLSGTAIDDAGLAHLTELKHLKRLRLSDTKVTDEGIAKLKAALPNCRVVSDYN